MRMWMHSLDYDALFLLQAPSSLELRHVGSVIFWHQSPPRPMTQTHRPRMGLYVPSELHVMSTIGARLPTRVYAKPRAGGTELTCAICLEDVAEGEVVRSLPCLHSYHGSCVDRWFEHSVECPVCKCDVNALMNKQD